MEKVALLPEWYGSSFEGYAVNYLNKNFWRVATVFGDFEDALSEACLIYYECRRLYGDKVNTRAHFMALYKRMVWTWFTDYSNYDTKQRRIAETYRQPESAPFSPPYAVILESASSELKQVIQLILNAPEEVVEILRKDTKRGSDRFFQQAVELCHIPADHAPALKKELLSILA